VSKILDYSEAGTDIGHPRAGVSDFPNGSEILFETLTPGLDAQGRVHGRIWVLKPGNKIAGRIVQATPESLLASAVRHGRVYRYVVWNGGSYTPIDAPRWAMSA
jgi:hypothetical protein